MHSKAKEMQDEARQGMKQKKGIKQSISLQKGAWLGFCLQSLLHTSTRFSTISHLSSHEQQRFRTDR